MFRRKGCPDLICDEFYNLLDLKERWALKPGQFYFTHVVYPQHYPTILKLTKYDPKNEAANEFLIKPYSEGDEKHYPIHKLKLRESEMYYVYKGKKRLVIVLGYVESEWFGKAGIQKVVICAPVFGFRPSHSQEMVVKTQAFVYPNMFYLPPDPKGCYEESAVRFEMTQPIMKGYLQPYTVPAKTEKRPVQLSKTAYWLMMTHFVKYICGKVVDERLNEDIKAYQEMLLESLERKD